MYGTSSSMNSFAVVLTTVTNSLRSIERLQVPRYNSFGVAAQPGKFLGHIEDDAHPFEVDASCGQMPYELEALDVALGVAAAVPFGARGDDQLLLFVNAQRARVQPQEVGGHG